jgi:hypothetical protein
MIACLTEFYWHYAPFVSSVLLGLLGLSTVQYFCSTFAWLELRRGKHMHSIFELCVTIVCLFWIKDRIATWNKKRKQQRDAEKLDAQWRKNFERGMQSDKRKKS